MITLAPEPRTLARRVSRAASAYGSARAMLLTAAVTLTLDGCTRAEKPVGVDPGILSVSSAPGDTGAVLTAALAHYGKAATRLGKSVTIRGDTSWATVYHGDVTFVIARLERRDGQWRFVREDIHGIH